MSKCKGCGKKIVWGVTVDGQRIPLDPVPPVYHLYANDKIRRALRADYMVSHFATCPNANDFSGKNKERK